MFYKLDFTRTQYRRRKAVAAGLAALAILGAGMLGLFSIRLNRMSGELTPDQRLRACNANAQMLLHALEDWGHARQRFQEIEPFWKLDTTHPQPSTLLALVLTNQPVWRQWLSPKRLAMTANDSAAMEFNLWFRGDDKAGVLATVRAALTNGLPDWSPKVIFEEEEQLADLDRIWVRVECVLPRHRWQNGMAEPPGRLTDLATVISNHHAAVWEYSPLKGFDKTINLEAAVDKALLEAMQCLTDEKGKDHLAQWKACRRQTLSPSEVFDRVRHDVRKQGVTAELCELARVESAWRHLAGRWWCLPRGLDCAGLKELEQNLKVVASMDPGIPPHQTFAGFGVWIDQYLAVFTNALTSKDIRLNGRDRRRLEEIYAEVLTRDAKLAISSVERVRSGHETFIGYSDWTLRPSEGDGTSVDLDKLHALASRLDRATPGIRLYSLEVLFDDKRKPDEAWSVPPKSSLFKGLIPWQIPEVGIENGGLQ